MTITSRTARSVRVSAAILATLTGLVALTAPPAVAGQPTAPAPAPASGGVVLGADGTVTVDSTNRYLAGYTVAIDSGRNHRVTSRFAVPAITCRAPLPAPVTVAAGLTGRRSGSSDGAGLTMILVVACAQDGGVDYSLFFASSGSGVGGRVPLTPGQLLTVTVGATADRSTGSLTDAAGRVLGRGQNVGFRAEHAQFTVQSPAGPRVGRVAAVSFTGATVNAAPLAGAAPTRVQQVDADGTVLATPTALTGSGGDFRVRFVPQV